MKINHVDSVLSGMSAENIFPNTTMAQSYSSLLSWEGIAMPFLQVLWETKYFLDKACRYSVFPKLYFLTQLACLHAARTTNKERWLCSGWLDYIGLSVLWHEVNVILEWLGSSGFNLILQEHFLVFSPLIITLAPEPIKYELTWLILYF